MEKIKIKLMIDILMAIDFIIVIFSALSRNFREIHNFTGWLLVILVLIHLLFNWQWIKCMILGLFKKKVD